MDLSPQFMDVLRTLVGRSLYTPGQLAALTRIPEETIVNWLKGKVKKPRDWRDVLKLATALHLSESEATALLRSAGHPSVAELRQPLREWLPTAANQRDRELLAPWLAAPQPTQSINRSPEAALKQLAALPLDRVPDPAPLPPGSRMPFSRNPLFVGREDDLLSLAQAIKGGATVAIGHGDVIAATGLGGIGKTQLAVEFVHRYGQFFVGGVFWLSFADADVVPSEVAACGSSAFMALRPDFGNLNLEEQVELVRAVWQSAIPRLLIFDNCEDEALLAKWLPTTGGSRVLVTSRRAQWDVALGIQKLALDVLPREDSVTLLRKHRPDLPRDDADLVTLAAEIGDLPLALHLAGSYLLRYRHSVLPAEYVAQLRRSGVLQHPSLHSGALSPTRHVQDVARTFALSYDHLDSVDPIDRLALALLARLACFAPGEPVPRDLLLMTSDETDHPPPARTMSEDALARLVELGLADTTTDGALRLHRLVAAFVREQAGADAAQAAVEQTLLKLARQLIAVSDIPPIQALQRHLRHVADTAALRNDARAADLNEAFGHHLWLTGNFAGAHHYIARALQFREQHRADQPVKLAETYSLFGLLLQLQHRLNQAQGFIEQALAIFDQHLGSEHDLTATEHNNLGYILLLQGSYRRAETHLRQALAVRHRWHGVRHIDTARSLNHLGYLRLRQGYYRDARRYLKLALAIREQVLPTNHVSTAYSLNFLGEALDADAQYAASEHYYRRALLMREALFGGEHHDTAESYYKWGRLLHLRGKLDEARAYLERALAINLAIFEATHRDTAFMLDSLGALLRDQGHYEEARSYLERALAAWESVRADHPESVAPLNNLGLLALAQGDRAAARSYFDRALTVCRTTLDEAHPAVATTLLNLGRLLQEQGEIDQARRYYERALVICEQRLRPGHPLAQTVRARLDAINRAR